MKTKDTERAEEIRMEVQEATYVQAARRGEHRWWRYPLGLVVILTSWMVVSTVASLVFAFVLSG